MEFKNPKYFAENGINRCIMCVLDGKNTAIPIDDSNTHYIEIKRQVDAGELTIEDVD